MHILFIHKNFPAQFRYMAPALIQDGWQVSFLTARAEGEIPGVKKLVYQCKGGATKYNHLCTRNFENSVHEAMAVYLQMKKHPNVKPDLIVAHTGFGSSLFLPYLYDAPIINFMEYFYHPVGSDLGYRPEYPPTEEAYLRIKTKNAMILLDLANCDRGWTPTHYQQALFPEELRSKIDVIFDGIDTSIYQRRDMSARTIPQIGTFPPQTRVVTYVARGMEMMRGFDIFIRAAKQIYEQYPDVVFLVVGSDRVAYGADLERVNAKSFKDWVFAQDHYDLSKFIFTGHISEQKLAQVLSLSDLHIYLTEPFIASWSMVDAMSCGAVVLASDQTCTREYIRHGENGLLCDFFDVEAMARQAVEVLRSPGDYRHLAEAAIRTVEEKYSFAVARPRLKEYFQRVASRRRADPPLLAPPGR